MDLEQIAIKQEAGEKVHVLSNNLGHLNDILPSILWIAPEEVQNRIKK